MNNIHLDLKTHGHESDKSEGQKLFQKEGTACIDLTASRSRSHLKNRMFTKSGSYSAQQVRQGRPCNGLQDRSHSKLFTESNEQWRQTKV